MIQLTTYRKDIKEIIRGFIESSEIYPQFPNSFVWKDERVQNTDCKTQNVIYSYIDGYTENQDTTCSTIYTVNCVLGMVKPVNEISHITIEEFDNFWGRIGAAFSSLGYLKRYTINGALLGKTGKLSFGDFGITQVRCSGGDRAQKMKDCTKRVEMIVQISCNFVSTI